MTVQNHLRTRLASLDLPLLRTVEAIISHATPQLWATIATFSTGTDHTPKHTETVEQIGAMIFTEVMVQKLSKDEIAMFLIACHYHDLGMVGTEFDNSSEENMNQVRRQHAISIGVKIKQKWRELGYLDQTYAEVVGDICKGHRPNIVNELATWDSTVERRNLETGRFVRVKLISAMIYAADELHIGADRARRLEEEFREITNPLSLLHWRRHQAVNGPSPEGEQISFDVSPISIVAETDLRPVLRKAFRSLLHANTVFDQYQLPQIPKPLVTWLRDSCWTQLVFLVCRDLQARTKTQIADEVNTLWNEKSKVFQSIDDCCEERYALGNIEKDITACLEDQIRLNLLRMNDDKFVLSTTPHDSQTILDSAKHVDKEESVFFEHKPSLHEYHLFRSPFGRQHIENLIYPRIKSHFKIELNSHPQLSYIKRALNASPTAARVLTEVSIPQCPLSQFDLLTFALISGVCADMSYDPDLLIEKEDRDAIRALFEDGKKQLNDSLRFAEEMALLKPLTVNEISEGLGSWLELEESEMPEAKPVSLTHLFPVESPHWSIGHIFTASVRTGISASLSNNVVSTVNFIIPDKPELDSLIPESVKVSPTKASIPAVFSLRCTISQNENGEIEFDAQPIRDNRRDCPIIVEIQTFDKKITRTKIAVCLADCTISQALQIQSLFERTKGKETPYKIMMAGRQFMLGRVANLQLSLVDHFGHVAEELALVEPDLPVPLFIPKTSTLNESSKVDAILDFLRSDDGSTRTISTFFAKIAGKNERPFFEQQIGEIPGVLNFVPLDGKVPEGFEELSTQLETGEETVEAVYFLDEFPLPFIAKLKKWLSSGVGTSPIELTTNYAKRVKTKLTIISEKAVNRRWYMERRYTFLFEQLNAKDLYGYESLFWKERGDEKRSQLAKEIAERENVGGDT